MSLKIHSRLLVMLLLSSPTFLFAQSPAVELERFQQQVSVPTQPILVPTVIEIELPDLGGTKTQFLVVDQATKAPVASLFDAVYEIEPVPYTVSVNGKVMSAMTDDQPATSETFAVSAETLGVVTLDVQADEAFAASSFVLDLASNVALPVSVSVEILDAQTPEIVVAKKRLTSARVSFPKTTAKQWRITLEYGQPLRINELKFVQDDVESTVQNSLRFLAQPETAYIVYFDPEIQVSLPRLESGDLRSDEDVVLAEGVGGFSSNPLFVFADSDTDTVPDQIDNCINQPNPDQLDVNQNGRGDACDDFDRDGISNAIDNCINQPNRLQSDEDGDGLGDACDEEESRVTEKYAWIPWVAMGVAVLVFGIMFYIVLRRIKHDEYERQAEDLVKPPMSDIDSR